MLIGIFVPILGVRASPQNPNEPCTYFNSLNPDNSPCQAGSQDSGDQGSLVCRLDPNPKLQNVLVYGSCIINTAVIPLIFALAIAMFVWGVVQYVINSDEEAKKEKGKQFMIWGIIALTVMVSVWGLVSILGGTFGINTHFIPQVKAP